MTRKDYVLIADALYAAAKKLPYNLTAAEANRLIVEEIAVALAGDNPNFKPSRFINKSLYGKERI